MKKVGSSNVLPNSVAFTCICREPDGDVLRTVRHIEFTPEVITKLYQKISRFPTFMGQEIHSLEDMLRFFVVEGDNGSSFKPKGLCLAVDDLVGLFWLSDINGLFEASVHYTFFDRRHKGRVELCKKALRFCFETFKFHRLYTSVPVYAPGTMRFVESLGFVKYGRSRKNRIYKGRFYDACLYDLISEEFLNGTR